MRDLTLMGSRQNKVVGEVALLDRIGTNDLANQYLTGEKIQPAVFSTDLSRAYIAGNAKIYAIDLISFKLIETIAIPAGRNITSIVVSGDYLIFGEGEKFGSGSGGYRLMAIDTNPASKNYHKNPITLKIAGLNGYPYGVAGLGLGPDGKTLVVSMPKARVSYSLAPTGERGDVLVLDLSTLNLLTGAIAAPVKADLPAGNALKAPQTIKATGDKDRFLVSSPNDYNRGLSTLTLTRDAQGKVTSAKLQSIEMNQPGNDVRIDRLNIQRAQSAVLVEKDGVQYAIVADDNYNFLDPYWKAMYEAPMFTQLTPFGPPTPIGGSASAKKVALGGKLGIVKDPFGKNGQPQFMGATLPLDGYGIINLSLSKDGKVLIGQLKGGFSANIFDGQQKAHQSHAWNVEQLIAATLAHPDDKRLQKHIKLPNEAEQYITVPTNAAGYTAAPAGTMFNNSPLNVQYTGNMGDVIKVDLKELAARKLLNIADTVKDADITPPEREAIDELKKKLKNFRVVLGVLQNFGLTAARSGDPAAPQLLIVTKDAKDEDWLGSKLRVMGSTEADSFESTGVLYLIPNISSTAAGESDIQSLRNGSALASKSLGFTYYFENANLNVRDVERYRSGTTTVVANDFASTAATFFGDRPLNNPGYSKIELSGEVKSGSTNKLDVLKVEQRLKYLGFPAITTPTGYTIKDFTVDGTFGAKETVALKLFEKVVRYQSGGNDAKYLPVSTGADGLIENSSTGQAKITKDWLNAWNAPHWVNVGRFATTRSANWVNTQHEQADGRRENWGTSWMGDWLVAQQNAPAGLRTNLQLLFNGATDANHATTPTDHKSHDLGMAFDVGIKPRLNRNPLISFPNAPITETITTAGNPAIYQMQQATGNAQPTGNQLSLPPGFTAGWSDANAQWFVRPDTFVLFPNANQTPALRNANTAEGTDPSQGISLTNPPVYRLPSGLWQGNLRNDQRTVAAQILAMYSITNSNSSGYQSARTGLTGNDAEKATKAQYLFQGLFKSVFIGNSPTQYNNIRYVLNKLGVPLAGSNAGVAAHHEHHFHIAMGVPERRDLPQNLEAQSLPEEQSMIDMTPQEMPDVSQLFAQTNVPSISRPSQDWIGTNAKDRRAIQGWIQQQSQIEEGYQPRYSANGPLQIPTLKFNLSVDYAPRPNAVGKIVPREQMVNFGSLACMLMDSFEGRAGAWGPECKITQFIQRPGGRLVADNQPGALPGAQMYFPSRAGMHTARFILENGAGRKVDVTVKIRALLEMPGGHYDDPNATTLLADLGADDYLAWQRSANLSALIANAQQTLAGFTDLLGTALGQTTGEGTTAQITLDQNAAGHGWYIDSTPLDNADDYLPTSNPEVWQAKAGSAAAGKMDLLSVLLHEYGHALGLEHSAEAGNYMAASLQPGQRKLPSTDELALMARLVADLKTVDGEALTLALSQGERGQVGDGEQDPTNPFTPSPLSVLGLLPLGLMRRTGVGTQTSQTTQTDYLTAINPTLTNGNFALGQNGSVNQWETTGKVNASSSTLTLGESTTAQTHLAQAFVLSGQDRFLTFNVSNLALQNNSIQQNGILQTALLNIQLPAWTQPAPRQPAPY